ncbi:hypothetical protein ACSIGC_00350 [Tenacibaculum sp. ZS6-P6]|uniref:hypothetical protein n=1 Tax=Tenacibaculum sp. ZS6-P6 TaxID=3447503 RepID=UPI003F9CE0D4
MKADLIDTNYVYNHRFFRIWKECLLLYGILLIVLTMFEAANTIGKYDFYISSFSKFFVFSGMILWFMNSWLFLRIGEVSTTNKELILEFKDSKKVIELNSINQVIFGKEYRKFFYLKIQESELVIELDKNQIKELKNIFKEFNIEIKYRHYTDNISEWFKKITFRKKV